MSSKVNSDMLDDFDPTRLAQLRAVRPGPALDNLTEGEQAAIRTTSHAAGSSSARSLHAKLRRQSELLIRRHLQHAGPPRPPTPKYQGPPVRIGFDAEWVTLPNGPRDWRNELLCITSVLDCGGRQSRFILRPSGPLRTDRPTMPEFLQKVLLKAMRDGAVQSMPDALTVYGHFIRGDLASFQDLWAMKRQFRGLGRTLVSRREGHSLEVEVDPSAAAGAGSSDDEPADGSWSKTHPLALREIGGRRYSIRVRFIDTIKLTPGQRGLSYLGKMIGLPKLDLHSDLGIPAIAAVERPELTSMGLPARYGIDRMDLVMRDYPEQAERYAFRDSEIALAHGIQMERFATEQLGLRTLPNTLAACAAALVRKEAGGGEALAGLVGRQTVAQVRFDTRTRTYRRQKCSIPSAGLAIFAELGRNAYQGGRNECFYHGPTKVGTWYDYDLPGAYTTALAALRPVNYEEVRQELDPDAYHVDDMGLAWITFRFPPGTRFPCLPVRGTSGALFYPMQASKDDRVFVGAPEIQLAREMGAEVRIIQGFKAPWRSEERLFEPFTRLVQSKRREFPKATHPALNELWKEIGNSGYGLTAQGLKEKQAFDPATMRSQPIGQSPLTEPLMAAWTTSFVRGTLGEILSRVPAWGTVVSATTDGLLTDVPIDQLGLDGPLCRYFSDIRQRLFGAPEVLDPVPKHGARQLVSVAVRTTFTSIRAEGREIVCAKGSVKPPTRPDPAAQNRFMLRLYLGQRHDSTVTHEQLVSAREQLTREVDLYGISRTRRLNLRYDFKRRPSEPRMASLGRRIQRIAWDTVPWDTVEQAEFARSRAEGWSRERERVFKDMGDYRDWEAYFEASWSVKQACEHLGVRSLQVRGDNAWGILKRAFLQAGRRREWGASFEGRSLAKVAEALTAAGFPTGKEDITYAGRRAAPLVEHCVPWVPETIALLKVILTLVPTFEYHRAFTVIEPSAAALLLSESPPL
jgi:hypothetical protein